MICEGGKKGGLLYASTGGEEGLWNRMEIGNGRSVRSAMQHWKCRNFDAGSCVLGAYEETKI